ncbi:DUF805 domain-containing protein [Pseudomonas rubra]|uniref:DUF805 domain-containing protein n=1 Tax=Pseudomonas rubra TaxID=2942627 RepID=A0ABT5PG50_9PSED|nr:DUF805 domain-containing protein [Pseudomonas rubra]MDD1017292.1 DUF805 domain-containing protein [Pseudomonas rubra]MDD1041514.1 DUF805 domain-containing protein [Pseudomonas rubra]MDD1154786.1 DUF805 domain-containing protein [Pseudomonas rubra]
MNQTMIFADQVMSPKGRIGRIRLLAWSLALLGAMIAGTLLVSLLVSWVWDDLAALVLVGALIARIMSMIFFVKRLHDLNWSGWLCWLVLLPWVGNILLLLLLVMPGNRGENRFGPAPPPNSKAMVILASLWLVLIVAGVVLTVFRPGI